MELVKPWQCFIEATYMEWKWERRRNNETGPIQREHPKAQMHTKESTQKGKCTNSGHKREHPKAQMHK
jgi:hypothetical protein